MIKEFELWWGDNKDELRRSFRDDLSDAFAAGRALGRREVKGECLAVTREFESRPPMSRFRGAGDYIAAAIEAIPEG